MTRQNLYLGVGMGAAVCAAAALLRPNKKRRMKSALGKAVRALGEVADTVSDTMGW
ncbi:MAG: hypothetical protein J5927_04285 [Oscillospiraceae bacterium]|nr:hypothetical protein [Oscillospiraceae bacterium]